MSPLNLQLRCLHCGTKVAGTGPGTAGLCGCEAARSNPQVTSELIEWGIVRRRGFARWMLAQVAAAAGVTVVSLAAGRLIHNGPAWLLGGAILELAGAGAIAALVAGIFTVWRWRAAERQWQEAVTAPGSDIPVTPGFTETFLS